MGKNNDSSVTRGGFLQALSVAAYISLVVSIIWNIEKFFGKKPNFFGPMAFLMLFSTSVLTCGLLVFYKPYKLFFAGKKQEAIDLVLQTAVFLFCFFLLFISLAVLLPKT